MREAMAPLIGLLGLDVWDDGAQVQIARPQGAAQMIGPTQLGAQPGAMGGPATSRMAAARHGLTSALRLRAAGGRRLDWQVQHIGTAGPSLASVARLDLM
jgi:hypothetical protein